jgi:hypothetical protein
MPATTPDELRHAAHALEQQAEEVRRAVRGLLDLTGPSTWAGGAPRRLTDELEQGVHLAQRAADQLDADAATVRTRAGELQRAQALSSLPPA